VRLGAQVKLGSRIHLRYPRGLRTQLTLWCSVAALLLSAGASALFLLFLHRTLFNNLDEDLRARASVLSSSLPTRDVGGLAPLLSKTADYDETSAALSAYRRPDGVLLSVTGVQIGRLPLPASLLQAAQKGGVGLATVTVNDQDIRLAAQGVPRSDGTWIALAGSSKDVTDEAVHDVGHAVVVGIPVVVLLVAVGAWLLAGAALRPVERMRRDADSIAESGGDGRLGVPRTEDEIAALAQTLNEMLERLQRSRDRQQSFVADAGHELRTPLAVLRTELELASRPGRSQGDLRDAVGHAAVEVERLSQLADALLFLARADGGAPLVRLEDGDAGPILADAVRAVRAAAHERGVEVDLEVPRALPMRLDVAALRRAVDNALSNALEHAPRGSRVTVTAEQAGGVITLAVTDEGPGFPAEFLPLAFERFQRADSARTHVGGHLGSGLGLSIVAEVASAHGGTADVSNVRPHGARIQLRLPASGDGSMTATGVGESLVPAPNTDVRQ
jgi:two-component system OmpR family sensor kinase